MTKRVTLGGRRRRSSGAVAHKSGPSLLAPRSAGALEPLMTNRVS